MGLKCRVIVAAVVGSLLMAGCSSSQPVQKTKQPTKTSTTARNTSGTVSQKTSTGKTYTGMASYYADRFHGNKTASGEKYDKNAYTCAHRTLAFGTMLKVTNLSNNKSVTVRVNDRGPFKEGRIVDLSAAAAKKIDMITAGVVKVKIEVISEP